MGSVDTVQLRAQLSEVVNRVAYGKERLVLKRRGKGLAVLVPLEDAKRLEELEALEDAADAQAGRRALAEFRKSRKKAIPLSEVKRRLGI
jgi:prevent-host-death family protein